MNEKAKNALKSKDNKILYDVEQAPEPSDIIWANLGIQEEEKFKFRAISFGISVAILLGALLVVYLANSLEYTDTIKESNAAVIILI